MSCYITAMCARKPVLLLILLCLGSSLAACARPHAILSLPQSAGRGFPPFPPPREVAALTPPQISGVDTEQRSTAALPFGSALALDASAPGSPALWGLYRLNPGGQWDSVSVLLESASGAYVCLANYATNRWMPHGPYTGLMTLAAPALDYRSPSGDMWVAVVCAQGSAAQIHALSTDAVNPGNLPPTADLQSDVAGGIVPLTVNFDAAASADPDGSVVQYAWDFDGDSVWDDFTASPQTSHTYAAPGNFNAQVRATDNQLLYSAVDTIAIVTNAAPRAQLLASTQAAAPGAALDLDASGSTDADGSITDYEWDLDGNGIFDEAGAEAAGSGQATVATTFPAAPAYFNVGVRVTDDRAAQATATLDLTAQGWLKLTLDGDAPLEFTNQSGSQCCLAVVGGNPAVSYRDNGTLRYAWSTTPDGSSGWNSLEVDGTCSPGQTSMAVINGTPAICYDGADLFGSTEVRYARSTAADGSSGWSNLLLDVNGGYDLTIALAELGGLPAVAYIEDTTGMVEFGRSTQPDGSGGWSFTSHFVGIGAITPLVEVQGNPALAATVGKVQFIRSGAPDGSGSWTAVDVDSTLSNGKRFPYLALMNGSPAISHSHSNAMDLRYSWSTSTDGSSGWSTVEVDTPGNGGGQTWLGVVDGLPAICYHDATNDVLKFARSTAVDGSSGWTTSTVDTGAGVFLSGTLLASGQPAVSYYDFTNSDLKYAVLFE
jgi:PKD repeat protein